MQSIKLGLFSETINGEGLPCGKDKSRIAKQAAFGRTICRQEMHPSPFIAREKISLDDTNLRTCFLELLLVTFCLSKLSPPLMENALTYAEKSF